MVVPSTVIKIYFSANKASVFIHKPTDLSVWKYAWCVASTVINLWEHAKGGEMAQLANRLQVQARELEFSLQGMRELTP